MGRVGIVGADIPIAIVDRERASLGKALATVRARCEDAVANGELSADGCDRRLALLAATVYFRHPKDCDLVVDTADTAMSVKEHLVRRLDDLARPGAILMTCHAHSDLNRIAGLSRRAGEVPGLQILNPAN